MPISKTLYSTLLSCNENYSIEHNMTQLSDRDRTKSDVNKGRNKTIEYSCGCIYLFDHEIILKHICQEHETHLITNYG